MQDDRLRLIFTCCHPALSTEAQVALTLRLLGGLTTEEVARCVPRHRADDGATPRPRQAQDQGGADPLPRAGGPRAPRPPAPRAGRRLPHLQRRADQPGRTGSLLGGDPAGADPGDADARRAGGGRPAGAVAPDRVPSRVANAARRLPRAARRAGPHTMGSRPDRGRPGDRPPLPSPQPTRRVSAPGGHQRRARGRRDVRARPTGRRSSPCTTSCSRSPPRRSWRSTARSPSAKCRAPPQRWRWWTSLDLDDYYPFHATRADLLRRLGRSSEAAAAYERAAALAPTDAERDFLRLGGRASR